MDQIVYFSWSAKRCVCMCVCVRMYVCVRACERACLSTIVDSSLSGTPDLTPTGVNIHFLAWVRSANFVCPWTILYGCWFWFVCLAESGFVVLTYCYYIKRRNIVNSQYVSISLYTRVNTPWGVLSLTFDTPCALEQLHSWRHFLYLPKLSLKCNISITNC